MKRLLLALLIVGGFTTVCFGASNQVYIAYGQPYGIDNVGVLTDTAETLPALVVRMGGTWQRGGNDPVGCLIVAETNDARFHFSPATPTYGTKGFVLAAGSSMYWGGISTCGSMILVNSATGVNSKIHVALFY